MALSLDPVKSGASGKTYEHVNSEGYGCLAMPARQCAFLRSSMADLNCCMRYGHAKPPFLPHGNNEPRMNACWHTCSFFVLASCLYVLSMFSLKQVARVLHGLALFGHCSRLCEDM
eukprot:454952-Pelagomonas_calceolata.AAC.1